MAKEVSKSCRTCLGNNGELVSIYNGDDNSVVEMLEYILDTQLEKTHGLPQKVCYECFNDISRCYSFKTKCNNSFKILSNLLDKRKNEPLVMEMQIKQEPEANVYDEFYEVQTEKTPDTSLLEMEEISIKTEPPETNELPVNEFEESNCIRQLSRDDMQMQQLQLYEEDTPLPTTISSTTNNPDDSDHCEYFQQQINQSIHNQTVQFLIRELKDCASCGAGFAHDTDFNEHMKVCRQKKQTRQEKEIEKSLLNTKNKHLCYFCDKAFPRPCRLKNHLRKYHQEEEKALASKLKGTAQTQNKHKCSHCNLSFNLESSLKYHLSSHTKEKLLHQPLNFNKQSFKKGLNLNRQLPYHPNSKIHRCKQCYQEFELSSQLKIHMSDHKTKHPNVCRFCQKQFIYEHELKAHSILMHNGEKPFQCRFCSTVFTEKYNLIYHQRNYLCRGK